MQAAAALVSYYIVFIDHGFSPASLLHAGPDWDDPNVAISDSYGRVRPAGEGAAQRRIRPPPWNFT